MEEIAMVDGVVAQTDWAASTSFDELSAELSAAPSVASPTTFDVSSMGGFQTGRGASIVLDQNVLEAAAARFKQWQSDANVEGNLPAVGTAASKADDVGFSRAFSPSNAPDFNSDTSQPTFCTGSGRAVVISEGAKAKGRELIESVDADLMRELPIATSKAAAANSTERPFPQCSYLPYPSSDPHFDIDSCMPSFSTGLGKKLAPSAQALRQAEKMMEKEDIEFEKGGHGAISSSVAASASSHPPISAAAATLQTTGFSSKKPFKPPAATRTPAARPAATTPTISVASTAAVASVRNPSESQLPSRTSRLDLLDAQIADMARGQEMIADLATADAAAYGLQPASAIRKSGFSSAGRAATAASSFKQIALASAISGVVETPAQRVARIQKELMEDLLETDMCESVDFAAGKTYDSEPLDEKATGR